MNEGGKKPDRRDVNAIWQNMNASRPINTQSFERLWHGFSSDVFKPSQPCNSSAQDTLKLKVQQLKVDPLPGKLAAARNEAIKVPEQQAAAPGKCLEGAALERLVQALQSPDACLRKAALHQLQVRQ